MAYITTPEQLAKYITFESDFAFEKFSPYFKIAERKLQEMLGKDLFKKLEDPVDDPELVEANDYACGYIATTMLSNALNSLKLKINNVGIKTSNPSISNESNWWELKDLNRDLVRFSNENLNYLFLFLEENLDDFKEWEKAPIKKNIQNKYFKTLSDFEAFFSLNNNFITFYALQPFIRDAQVLFLEKEIGECLKSDLSEDILTNLKGALANFTISSVADSGLFKLEENGGLVKVELMPWEKIEKVSDIRLERLKDQRKEIAYTYLKNALDQISKLECFQQKNRSEVYGIKKKSGLFIGRR